MKTYPIYILDLDGNDKVVFPKEKSDLSHSEFWEETVAGLVAAHFGIPRGPLTNLPYCQRRARISSNGSVYFGEQQTNKLLNLIATAVGAKKLSWVYDDHEKRLPLDISEFERMILV